jgi:hypothetical protein
MGLLMSRLERNEGEDEEEGKGAGEDCAGVTRIGHAL